jgi:hypothetical protein
MNFATAAVLHCAVALALAADLAAPIANSNVRESPPCLRESVVKPGWVNYTDSAEGAFSMDVPVGWQVQGGMYRFGYFDVRWMMDVRSLDGKIIIRINDVNIPPHALPGQQSGREGQPYSKPQQFQMVVASYRSGQSYAEFYAKHRFSAACTTLTSRQADWTPVMPQAWRSEPSAQSTEGSSSFDCASSEGARIANVFVRTTLYPSNNFWTVDPVISVIATPEGVPLAHSMVQHMIDSWKKNADWEQYQNRITQMGLDQIRRSFGQFLQQMQAYHQARNAAMNQQVASYESRQNAQTRQVSSWGDTLTGLQKVSDPQTGKEFQVFSGPKANYYTNGTGVTVNSNLSPGSDFHQVNPVQP